MGELTGKIRADLVDSMKARDAARTSTLRMIQAALKNEQIAKGHELSDEEVETILRRALKQRQDSIEQYRKGGREDLALKEEAELALIETYLPRMMDEVETEALVDRTLASTGASSARDMGRVMKEIMGAHRGEVDGKRVQEILARKLR